MKMAWAGGRKEQKVEVLVRSGKRTHNPFFTPARMEEKGVYWVKRSGSGNRWFGYSEVYQLKHASWVTSCSSLKDMWKYSYSGLYCYDSLLSNLLDWDLMLWIALSFSAQAATFWNLIGAKKMAPTLLWTHLLLLSLLLFSPPLTSRYLKAMCLERVDEPAVVGDIVNK